MSRSSSDMALKINVKLAAGKHFVIVKVLSYTKCKYGMRVSNFAARHRAREMAVRGRGARAVAAAHQ